jgi:hypothetical protein
MPLDNIADLVNRPPEPPGAELSKAVSKGKIIQRIAEGIGGVKAVYVDVMTVIWRNPNGLTPKQVFAALDVHALSLVRHGEATLKFLEAVQPGSTRDLPQPTAGWTLAPELTPDQQPTGRVIVTEPA